MASGKKAKDRELLQEYIERFEKLDTETLVQRLSIIINNDFARQAINIILKTRGIK
jgi:hypothetical protein